MNSRQKMHLIIAPLTLAVCAAAGAQPSGRSSVLPPPQSQSANSPAEQRAREYLALVNAGGSGEVANYVRSNFASRALEGTSVDRRVLAVGFYRYFLGPAQFVRFHPISPTKGSIVFQSALQGRLQRLTVEVEPDAPHRVTAITGPESIPGTGPTAHNESERIALLDQFVRQLAGTRYFSGVVVLVRGGAPVFQKAYGDAEWRFGVPHTLDTRFYAGSIAKTFTAVAIAQLVEQGKISWDDPLARFVPGYPTPEAAAKIRIKHLLAHTSGLGNVYPSGTKMAPDEYRNVADYMAKAPTTPLEFEPGKTSRYSNLGYVLLARVVEIASGQDFYDYIAEHVFKPAGMVSAGTEARDRVVEKLAYGYEPNYSVDGLQFQENTLKLAARAAGFGGAYVTADDLLRFGRALRDGTLIKPQTWQLMSTAKPEIGAPDRGYGFSVGGTQGVSGRGFVGHGGNTMGVCTSWGAIDDATVPYTYVILSNSGIEACRPIVEYVFDLIPPAQSRGPTNAENARKRRSR